MTATNFPNLPVPAGATADDWTDFGGLPGPAARSLKWSRHDIPKAGVSVDGWQYEDGRVEPQVSVYIKTDDGFTAEEARALAAALIEAADALDAL